MLSEVLYQILLGVLIIAVIALIFVLVRLYLVLTDLNQASKVISEKVTRIGKLIDHIVNSLESFREGLKGFFESFKSVAKVKEKFSDFWNDKKEPEEEKK